MIHLRWILVAKNIYEEDETAQQIAGKRRLKQRASQLKR